jgi:ABC-2 type transport system permease protein
MEILLALTPYNVEGEFLEKINSGDIGTELCRPFDLYTLWFMKQAAGRLVPLFWRGLPLLIVGLIMPAGWRLGPPAAASGVLLMLLSCVFSLFLCSAYAMFVTVIRMNVSWGDGPMYMILTFGQVFSGAFLPLQLWPDFLQKILFFQPFAGYIDIPLRFYNGTISGNDAYTAFLMQIVWIFIFIAAGKLLMRSRLRKVIVQGG